MIVHPISTANKMYESGKMLFELTKSNQWEEIAEILSPEAYELATQWEYLSFERRGELSGYVFGKHGADLLIPAASIKGIKGAMGDVKLLANAANAASKAAKTLILESVSGLETSAKMSAAIQLRNVHTAKILGFNEVEITQLENIGKIENTINSISKNSLDPVCDIKFANHALQRAIEREVSRQSILDALQNPLKIGEIKIDSLGRPSQRFIGQKAEVVINPDNRQVISVNPTSTKKFEKIADELNNANNRAE